MKLLNILIIILGSLLVIDFFPYESVDKEFVSYNDIYDSYVRLYCFDAQVPIYLQVSIKFDNLETPTIGYCQHTLSGYKIRIDKSFWDRATDLEKETLMFHEKAHCVLSVMHREDYRNYMYDTLGGINDSFTLYNQMRDDIITFCKKGYP